VHLCSSAFLVPLTLGDGHRNKYKEEQSSKEVIMQVEKSLHYAFTKINIKIFSGHDQSD